MKKLTIKLVCMTVVTCMLNSLNGQTDGTKKTAVVGWDGMAVGGYVNQGGFVNFGGPTVKLIRKPFSYGFGILPTMRIKKDNVEKGAPKNSAIMPTAGFGFTIVYKHLALQVPFYYNAKTATRSGKWNPGIGIGYKF
ncbi:MAG TPA: hypothetical protein VF144_02365 [Chitinophagaceae bacterium]